jgi:two-component system, NtrC family, response regulator HydG
MRALLTAEAGQASPALLTLDPERRFTLGRNHRNSVILQDECASRHHAELVYLDGRWLLRDLDTLNGTRLEGQRIREATALDHNQVIGIGSTRLRFLYEPSDEETHIQATADPDDASPADPPSDVSSPPLEADKLTALYRFMALAMKERSPRKLIRLALEAAQQESGAELAGFVGPDPNDPQPRQTVPTLARVDLHLSRKLTEEAMRLRQTVWRGSEAKGHSDDLDSTLPFKDALGLPLLADGEVLGVLHVYRAGRLFSESEVCFCELVAQHLAPSLLLLQSKRKLQAENTRLRDHPPDFPLLIGDSAPMRELRRFIDRVAPRPSTVLIRGESGVGKELVALALHSQSSRRDGPFVPFNCAAVTPSLMESELFGHKAGAFSGAIRDHPGLFRYADEGTLFLDEVGEMSLDMQAKLLRVLEVKAVRPVGETREVRVDVRVVAATNRDLQERVKSNQFREDLYYRLNIIPINVPPLRERPDDIPLLASHFLKVLSADSMQPLQLSDAALARMQAYAWPGNVRELRAALENAATLCDQDVLGPDDLLLGGGPTPDGLPGFRMEEVEAWAIRRALRQTQGNVTQAARLLEISRDTLTTKMKKYHIERGGA